MGHSPSGSPYHETERHAVRAMTVLAWVLLLSFIVLAISFMFQDGQFVPIDQAFVNFKQSAGEFGEFLGGFAYSIVAEIERFFR